MSTQRFRRKSLRQACARNSRGASMGRGRPRLGRVRLPGGKSARAASTARRATCGASSTAATSRSPGTTRAST
eukprot:4803740-Alexandrium_andersonii.AAC.1